MKKGFDRLRGVAAASAIGIAGLAGGGSARAATATLPLTVTTGSAAWYRITGCSTCSSTTFAISEAILSTAATSYTDFYDDAMEFGVNGTMFSNPDSTVDLTGTTVTTDVVMGIVAGVDAHLQYYFDPNRAVVRALFTLENTTGADINATVNFRGNYGSDEETTIQATQSGDRVVDDTDLWVVSNDSGVVGDDACMGCDPTATLATHGSGASVVPTTVTTLGGGETGFGEDDWLYDYDVIIPAMGTVRILAFNEMTTTIAAATAGATDFESLTAAGAAGLLTGIDAAAQAEIVNYAAGGGPVVAADDDDDDGLFALGMPGLLGMLGSLLLFRQRGRKESQ